MAHMPETVTERELYWTSKRFAFSVKENEKKMKKICRNIFFIILIFTLILPISNELELINFNVMKDVSASKDAAAPDFSIEFESIVINPGSSERDLNFTWYANTDAKGVVQMAEYKSEQDLTVFPGNVKYKAKAASTPVRYTEGESQQYEGFYTNKASISRLKPNTKYVYRVGNAGEYSEIYTFEVKGNYTDWSFYFAGDPQLNNNSADAQDNKTVQQWKSTIEKMKEINPDASLLVLGGDLANDGGNNESQYVAGLLAPKELKSMAMAATVGNHDQRGSGTVFADHFNNPNQTDIAEYNDTPGDYWYTYNNALFIHLNMSTTVNCENSLAWINSHVEFIKEAIEANPDTDWHILVFHESLFSAASHSTSESIANVRNTFAPKLSEINETHGIDLVLSGHDHHYSRSYVMNGIYTDEYEYYDYITDPNGIIYITANTSSGIKYYDRGSVDLYYLAALNQERTPNISNVEITGDGETTSLHIVTYRNTVDPLYVTDAYDMSVVDELTIMKTKANKKWGDEKDLTDAASLFAVTIPNIFSQNQAKLDIQKLTGGENYYKLKSALSADSKFKDSKVLSGVYDTSLTLDGRKIETNGMMVYIPVPEIQEGYVPTADLNNNPVYNIYALDESGSAYKIQDTAIVYKNEIPYVAFETDSVSSYAVGLAVKTGKSVKKIVGEGGKANIYGDPVKGEIITVNVNPDIGKEINTIRVTDKNGYAVKVTGKSDLAYTFINTDPQATVKVTFRDVEVDKISMTNSERVTLKVGKGIKINASASPANAALTYASDNTKAATVMEDGRVTAVGRGIAKITVKGKRGSASKTVTVVVMQPVTSLKVSTDTLNLKKGDTHKIEASVTPQYANIKKLKYKSNKPKIVKVSDSGQIKAVRKGTAKITVSTTDGTNIKAKVKVKVQ